MKMNKKSIIALVLSVLLLVSAALLVFAQDVPADPNTLLTKSVSASPVQDGLINGHKLNGKTVLEYGLENPVFHLTEENGSFWAEDMNGNPLEASLPSYIDLYLSRDDDALYAAIIIQEENHSGNYALTTFLGFGDAADNDTKNSGALTTFVMNNSNSARYDDGTWLDTQVTKVSGRKVAADGTVTNTTSSRRYNEALSYALPYWGSVGEDAAGNPITIFEVELDFKDSLLASGKSTSSVPAYGYFSFDLNLYSGSTQIGVLHCAQTNLKGTENEPDGTIKTTPFMVDLVNEPNPEDANALLSSLTFGSGTLTEAFSSEKTNYTLEVLRGTTSVTVNAKTDSENASYQVIGNTNLSEDENIITVKVSAKNGVTKTYRIEVKFVYNTTDVYVNAASGNDSTGNGSKDAPYKTVAKAISAKKGAAWSEKDALRILVTGTATDASSLLFGEGTIFNSKGDRLPIIIEGQSGAALTLSGNQVAAGNSYIFKNLTLNTAANSKFYAGSGEVIFENVTFGNTTTSFFGDDFASSGAFDAWQSVSDGTVTSVTIGKGTTYNGTLAAVGGESTANSSKIIAKLIVDGGKAANVKGRVSTNVSIKESAIVVIDGAEVTSLIGVNGGDHSGDLSITIGKNAKDTSIVKELIAAKGNYTLSGWSKLNILGGTVGEANGTTAVHTAAGGAGALGTVNTISGGTLAGGFAGVYTTGNMTSVGNVTNNVTGGTFSLSFVGGSVGYNKSVIIPKVTNNIGGNANIGVQGGILTDESGTAETTTFAFVGASIGKGAIKIKDVENNISGNANVYSGFGGARIFSGMNAGSEYIVENITNNFTGGTSHFFYAGSRTGGAVKTITNNIENSSINTFYAGSNGTSVNSGSSDNVAIKNTVGEGSAIGTFYGGTASAAVTGKIQNTVNGGNITTFYGASASGTVNGKVSNEVNGGSIATFYAASDSGKLNSGVETTINGGEINTYYGACNTGEIKSGNITNTMNGGEIYTFFGGSVTGNIGTESSVEITNEIKDGKISGLFYGGNYNGGSITGNITNNISGGEFHISYASTRGGSISGTTLNYITGGHFDSNFIAGTGANGATGGAIVTQIPAESTAIFEGSFYGGNNAGKSASATTTIAGGTFNGTVVPGSATGSTTKAPELILSAETGSPKIFGNVTCTKAIGGDGEILLGKNASVTVDGNVEGNLTVKQTEGWLNGVQYFYAKDITGATINITSIKGSSGSYKESFENGYTVVGHSVSPVAAKLLLDTRVSVKLYFAKDEIKDDFTYQVYLGDKELGSETVIEDDYYVIIFDGVGLSDFTTEFAIRGNAIYDPNEQNHNTIVKLAEIGAEATTKANEKALFRSIADLGRVAKDPDGAKYNLNYKNVVPSASGQGAEEGALLTFTGKNLLMSDAMGIRLYGEAKTAEDLNNIQIFVDGEDVTSMCDISEAVQNGDKYEFTVDLFISVSKMQYEKRIVILDQNGKTCLQLTDRVDWIAQMIIDKEPENNLAKQVLIYIQKTYDYIHNINEIVDPSTPGNESEIGGKVELFD